MATQQNPPLIFFTTMGLGFKCRRSGYDHLTFGMGMRTTHQNMMGLEVTIGFGIGDNSTLNFHAAHVTGTVVPMDTSKC
jgi:hypothetical protein